MAFIDPDAPNAAQEARDPNTFKDPEETNPSVKNIPKEEMIKPKDVQPQGAKQNPFMSAIQGFNRGIGGYVEGALQLGAEGLEEIGVNTKGFRGQLKKQVDKENAAYEVSKAQNPRATQGGYITGLVGGGGVLPGGAKGKFIKKIITGAAAGFGLGFSSYTEEGESRMKKGVIGALAGGLIPGLVHGAKAGIKGVKSVIPTKGAARRQVVQGLKGEKINEAAMKAADELDIPLTPGEATGSKILSSQEGRIPMNLKTQKVADEILQNRENVLRKSTTKIIDDMVPDGDKKTAELANKLYSKTTTEVIPKKVQEKILKDPVVMDSVKKLEKNAVARLSEHPKGSVGYYHTVAKHISGEVDKLKLEGNREAAKSLLKAKDIILDSLDDASPQFKRARGLSEQIITKRNYMAELDKIPVAKGERGVTVSQMYKKLLATPAKKEKFLRDVVRTGGDPKKAKAIIEVLEAVEGSPIEKLSSKVAEKTSDINISGGPVATVWAKGKKLLESKHSKELLRLALDKSWSRTLDLTDDMPLAQKIGKLATALTTASTKAATSELSREGDSSAPVTGYDPKKAVDPNARQGTQPTEPVQKSEIPAITEEVKAKTSGPLGAVIDSKQPEERGTIINSPSASGSSSSAPSAGGRDTTGVRLGRNGDKVFAVDRLGRRVPWGDPRSYINPSDAKGGKSKGILSGLLDGIGAIVGMLKDPKITAREEKALVKQQRVLQKELDRVEPKTEKLSKEEIKDFDDNIDTYDDDVNAKSRVKSRHPTPGGFTKTSVKGSSGAQKARNFIAGHEGFVSKPYWDVRQWSAGYGTKVDGPNVRVSKEEAQKMLTKRIAKDEKYIRSQLKVDVTDNEMAALLSFAYNLGRGRLGPFIKDINNGNKKAAADRLLRYNKAGGKVLEGLQKRRRQERDLFLSK